MDRKVSFDEYSKIIHSIKMKCSEIIKVSREILDDLDELTLKINFTEKKEGKDANL